MKIFIDKLKNKQDLSFAESKNAFEILMNGKASDDEIFDFLTLLSTKGESSDEIAGGVFILRDKSKSLCGFLLETTRAFDVSPVILLSDCINPAIYLFINYFMKF